MKNESRVKKTMLNAKINLICYFASIFVVFFTRKIFIDRLGTEFIGLTGTLTSLLGILNIAESGVGAAIAYTLYKPIFDADRNKIGEVVSVLGYLYQRIGAIILCGGIILSIFLPAIFPNTGFSWFVIYFGFYAFLTSSLLGYFINYRTILLSADQRNYLVTGYFQAVSIFKTILQMVFAIYTRNFILYLFIEIIAGIINSFILNWKINKTYPWLKSEAQLGKLLFKKYPEISTYTKQIFVHKIGGFVQHQISPILIYSFISISTVTLYGNYVLISQKLSGLIGSIFDSANAGVGNLISEGNKEKIYSTYKELFYIRIIFSGVLAFSFHHLVSKFIILWIGKEFLLTDTVLALISIHFFLTVSAGIYHQFLNGFGCFQDILAPIIEAVIFIITSIVLGHLWGLAGIICGPIISLLIIIHIWKPFFLYKKGLGIPFYKHWIMVLKSLIVITSAYLTSYTIFSAIGPTITDCWIKWILETISFTALLLLTTYTFSYILLLEIRSFTQKIIRKLITKYI